MPFSGDLLQTENLHLIFAAPASAKESQISLCQRQTKREVFETSIQTPPAETWANSQSETAKKNCNLPENSGVIYTLSTN